MESKQEEILIEILQNQVRCSREKAREALRKHQFNLVNAIHELKGEIAEKSKYVEEIIHVKGNQLMDKIKELLKKSNLVHLSILKNDKTLISIPVTISMVLFYLYPLLSTLSVMFFLKNEFTIKVIKQD